MKTFIVVLTIVVSSMFTSVAFSQDGQKGLAEQLLVLMKVDQQTTDMMEQMKGIQQKQLQAQKEQYMKTLTQEQFQQMSDSVDAVMDMVAQDLSWETTKDQYIDVYAKHYTVDDLKALIDFYGSDIGAKHLKATQAMLPELIQIGYGVAQKNQAKYQKAMAGAMQGIQ
ncbi:MAG: DUF2059 domain-containing protein [Candidatus Zapsychrus exili]|nr:DUF2059 domain-containing protein [Candidatus Zapsychrus exili]